MVAARRYTDERMSGRFIVLEGPDGSGTTSHSKALVEHLQKRGLNAMHTFEATDGPIGTFIRTKLKEGGLPGNAMQLLFTADRAWHEQAVLKPAMEADKIIVCDRYALSTIVYGTAFGFDPQWLMAMNAPFMMPDLELLALPPFETCMERLGLRDKDSFESDDSLQKKVYELYKAQSTIMSADTIFDTNADFNDTAAKIAARVDSFLAI